MERIKCENCNKKFKAQDWKIGKEFRECFICFIKAVYRLGRLKLQNKTDN